MLCQANTEYVLKKNQFDKGIDINSKIKTGPAITKRSIFN